MSLNVRKHGRWKAADWLWLAPFVLVASLWPVWRRRYWSRYVTVSVLTNTIYTPTGRISDSALRHEEWHQKQAREAGKARWGLRYALSTRWRIWYEAEAFYIQGMSAEDTIQRLRAMYLVRWPREHVEALVLMARSYMRRRGL